MFATLVVPALAGAVPGRAGVTPTASARPVDWAAFFLLLGFLLAFGRWANSPPRSETDPR